MSWRISFSPKAEKQLAALGRNEVSAHRTLHDRSRRGASKPPRPRETSGVIRRDFWRFRVGDYRVVYRIVQDRLLIEVIAVGHRREVYR